MTIVKCFFIICIACLISFSFINFIKWISVIAILLILVMGFNNFLDDPTASQSDPAWKEDYMSNMGMDE